MSVHSPPAAPSTPGPGIDAGVIEDARTRQRRHRRIGGVLVAVAAIAGVLIAGMSGGGGGGGQHVRRQPSGSGRGPGAAHARGSFLRAPATQKNGYGVETGTCPVAPSDRYLPPHSGCVTVRRADVSGDGRPDLVIVYSRLSRRHPFWYAPGAEPPSLKHQYEAEAAYLEVVLTNGAIVTTRIKGTRAVAIDAVAHVGADPGDEIFLEVTRISSGATGVAYGFHDGRLVPAGVYLSYGGDSGVQAGFDCVPGDPPRLIQRVFTFVGPNELTRSWREHEAIYAWHGPRLVLRSAHTFKRLVALKFRRLIDLKSGETEIGAGCLRGVS